MFIFQAIILGIIEGVTEFLPVSSTGHLIVAEQFVGFQDAAEIFTVIIQFGAIAAVIWFYKDDLKDRYNKFKTGDVVQQKFIKNLIIATVPAALIGLILNKKLQNIAKPSVVALALILGGVVLWLVEKYYRGPRQVAKVRLDQISTKQALGVGVAQIFSLIPGVSRSGSTIVGGMLGGMNRTTATSFSFYLAIPIMILASGFKVVHNFSDIGHIPGGIFTLAIGTFVSFVVALSVIRWLLKYIAEHNFKDFAYYRIIAGFTILFFVFITLLSDKVSR